MFLQEVYLLTQILYSYMTVVLRTQLNTVSFFTIRPSATRGYARPPCFDLKSSLNIDINESFIRSWATEKHNVVSKSILLFILSRSHVTPCQKFPSPDTFRSVGDFRAPRVIIAPFCNSATLTAATFPTKIT